MAFKPFKAPAGTSDVLPDDHDFYSAVKRECRHLFRQAGFRRISTPIFEETEAFERSLGLDSEIIKREIYSFEDPRGRCFSLRPEITTGVVRSFIENKMDEKGNLPEEFYYLERCYRFERPRARTKREFWQLGAEILGESDPAIDAQIIYLGHKILERLGIRDICELRINTYGTVQDREKYVEALANFYAGKERSLTIESREKLEQKKYFDLLTPRSEDEKILVKMAPKITEFLSTESQEFFDEMLSYLNSFGIEYVIDPALIRPIGYYSHSVFEFREKVSQQKILVGGRYDGLIKKMGGRDLGGAGFAAGFERLIDLMQKCEVKVPRKDTLEIFVAATGVVAKKHALPMLVKLREAGFHAIGVLGSASMEMQLLRAQKLKVPCALVIGDLEVRKNSIIVRNVEKGTSETIPADKLISHMKKFFGKDE